MTPPNSTGGAPPTAGNQRTVGGLLLGIALVLIVSSVAWFGNGQAWVGIAQIVVAVILAAVGGFLFKQSTTP